MFGTFQSSVLLDALACQAHSFRTSLGNVFEVYGLSESAIRERLSNLSPDEMTEVFEFVEALAEPRKPNFKFNSMSQQWPCPKPEIQSWVMAACAYFGLKYYDSGERLYFALANEDRLSFRPDLMQETTERLRGDVAFA